MAEIIIKSDIVPDGERGRILRYGIAPTTVALALAVRSLLTPYFPSEAIFLYFMPPVLIAAGIGGLGPALLATILGVAAVLLRLGAPSAMSEFGLVNGAAWATERFSRLNGLFDKLGVDGAVNFLADLVYIAGDRGRMIQTGKLRNYLMFLAVALVGLFAGVFAWVGG